MAAFSGRCEAYLALFNVKFQKFVMVAVFILDYRRVVVVVVFITNSVCVVLLFIQIIVVGTTTALKPTKFSFLFKKKKTFCCVPCIVSVYVVCRITHLIHLTSDAFMHFVLFENH